MIRGGKMEKYKLIESVCRYLVSVHNKRYELLRDRNIDLYNEIYELEGKLLYFIDSLGYEIEYGYDISYPMVVYKGEMVFKVIDVDFQEKCI